MAGAPTPTGIRTLAGVAYCVATDKRALSHRQAATLVAKAKQAGDVGSAMVHCRACGTWHTYRNRGRGGGQPRRQPLHPARWRRALRA
jgi:hypothetical protein